MSLGASLQNATSGLRAAQVGIDVVSRNIANATTPGYTRKLLPQSPLIVDGQSQGVRLHEVTRSVNRLLQQQVRESRSEAAALSVTDDFLSRLELAFGKPEDANSLASTVANLSDAFKALATTPESLTAQNLAINRAEDLARNLNGLSDNVQALRTEAESDIGQAVTRINEIVSQIDALNADITRRSAVGESTADLEDKRDVLANEMAGLIDIKYYSRDNGEMVIYTAGGRALLNGAPSPLVFNPSVPLTAATTYPGSINGIVVDGIDITTEITSGKLAGLIDLRDSILPQAQAQLDELASTMTQAFTALDLELFDDGGAAFVPANTQGYAGRIAVNAIVQAEPWRMRDGTVVAAPSPLASDATIPLAIVDMFDGQQAFAAAAGLGTTDTLQGYAASFISFQSSQRAQVFDRLANEALLADSLEQRLANDSGVNVDQEMALLVQLQNSYAASARVIQTVKEMFDTLLQVT